MIRNKVIGKEVSLHFLSPQCFMQIQQIRKKVSSQEGSGGSKIADTDKAQNGQSVSSCATFSYWQEWPSHCFSDQTSSELVIHLLIIQADRLTTMDVVVGHSLVVLPPVLSFSIIQQILNDRSHGPISLCACLQCLQRYLVICQGVHWRLLNKQTRSCYFNSEINVLLSLFNA